MATAHVAENYTWIDTCRRHLGIPQFATIVGGVVINASSPPALVVEGTPRDAGVWSEGDPLLSSAGAVEETPREAAGPPVEPDVDAMVDFNYARRHIISYNLRGAWLHPLSVRRLFALRYTSLYLVRIGHKLELDWSRPRPRDFCFSPLAHIK